MISAGSTLFAATRARPRDLEKARKSQDPPARKQPTLRWKDYLSIFAVIITCPLVWIAVLKCVLSPLDACHMMTQRFDGNFCRSAMDSETVIVFRADQGPTCQAWSDEGRNASYTAIQLEDADPEKLGDDMRRGWKGDVFDQCSLKMFESADCSGEPMAYIPEVRDPPLRSCFYPDSEDMNHPKRIQSVSLECRSESPEPEIDVRSDEHEASGEARLYL